MTAPARMSPRLRFAPSPTGFFHVGGARTALYNWAIAAGWAERSCCASRHDRRATDGVDRRNHRLTGVIGISADDPTFEGRTSPIDADPPPRRRETTVIRSRTTATEPDRPDAAPGERQAGGRRLLLTAGLSLDPTGVPLPRTDGVTSSALVRGRSSRHGHVEDCVLVRGQRYAVFMVKRSTMRGHGDSHVVRARNTSQHTKQQMLSDARHGRRCGPTCRAWSTSSAKKCRSGATGALEQYSDRGVPRRAMSTTDKLAGAGGGDG